MVLYCKSHEMHACIYLIRGVYCLLMINIHIISFLLIHFRLGLGIWATSIIVYPI